MKYYFITVMEDISYYSEGMCIPHIKNKRTWGFYNYFGGADRVLHNNITDLHEGCYDYAVIEEYEQGISGYTGKSWWFEFNEELGCYTRMDKPSTSTMLGSLALG